ncbi:hypothetical protein AB0P32_01685 [Streptomyces sp. NPDC085995]|uniref:hypothetical protein n=1 Tax=Streptomyces sp. NPDC085995 TaxID=3154861 RepID=UPI003446BB67
MPPSYVGCLNLRDALAARDAPLCRPDTAVPGAPALTCRGLYDVCLALRSDRPVVGSDVDADGALLLVVTGANEGGESTQMCQLALRTVSWAALTAAAASRSRSVIATTSSAVETVSRAPGGGG